MPAGLQIFDANGKGMLDTNMEVGRFLGIVHPGLGQTVYHDDRLLSGIPFGFAWSIGQYPALGMMGLDWPVIQFAGNAMIVTRTDPSQGLGTPDFIVYFGVR